MEREVERRNIKLFSCRSFSSFFFSYLSDNAKPVFLCVCVIPFAGSVFFFPYTYQEGQSTGCIENTSWICWACRQSALSLSLSTQSGEVSGGHEIKVFDFVQRKIKCFFFKFVFCFISSSELFLFFFFSSVLFPPLLVRVFCAVFIFFLFGERNCQTERCVCCTVFRGTPTHIHTPISSALLFYLFEVALPLLLLIFADICTGG